MIRWIKRLKRDKAPVLDEQASLWSALFEDAEYLRTAPRRLQEVQGEMVNRLGRVYQQHNRLRRQYAALLEGVIQVADLCEGLEGAGESVRAVHRAVMGLLEGQGVQRWEGQVGDLPDAGCEVVGFSERSDLAEGVIGEIIAPGYRLSSGEVFRRARVLINRRPAVAEPAPAPVSSAPEEEEAIRTPQLPAAPSESSSLDAVVEEEAAPPKDASESPPKAAKSIQHAVPKHRNPKHRAKGASR